MPKRMRSRSRSMRRRKVRRVGRKVRKQARLFRSRNVHLFVRRVQYTPLNLNAGSISGFSQTFTLSQLPNSTEFTSLYDQYKITGVKLEIWTDYNSASTTDPGSVGGSTVNFPLGTGFPYLYSCYDYDDNTAPASVEEMLQVRSMRRVTLNSTPKKYFFRPKPVMDVYRSAVGTAYSTPRTAPWLDVAYPDVPHYSFKGVTVTPQASNVAVGTTIAVARIMATFYIACKNVR